MRRKAKLHEQISQTGSIAKKQVVAWLRELKGIDGVLKSILGRISIRKSYLHVD